MYHPLDLSKLEKCDKLFIGFDINKNSTGCVILNEKGECVYSTVFTGVADKSFDDYAGYVQYNEYFYSLFNALNEIGRGESSWVLIEKPLIISRRMNLSLFLTRVTGFCISNAVNEGFFVREIDSRSLKKFVTGSGNSPKEGVLKKIESLLGFEENVLLTDGKDSKFSKAKNFRYDRADAAALAYILYWAWKCGQGIILGKENVAYRKTLAEKLFWTI